MTKTPKYQKFVHLYKKKADPWNLSHSIYEEGRFNKMIKLAKTVPHQMILEIGCGEGHFTQKLLRISHDVTALDVSEDAIKRAKRRAPRAKYLVTSIDDLDLRSQKFDLIIASEIIYYIRNKKPIFKKIFQASSYLLMSNYMLWDYILAPHLKRAKLLRRIHHYRLQEKLKYCAISLWKLPLK